MNVLKAAKPAPEVADRRIRRELLGRRKECLVLEQLMTALWAGQSQALVLRGEAGAGKTALLEHLLERAGGCRIARAAGTESETGLAFAGLHQLCVPFLGRLERLPEPQRYALGVAFGLRGGNEADRFLAGLAALSLLSEAAREQPLICVVDDVQWLDEASARALAFVARRMPAGPVAVLLAVRPCGREQELAGLPELLVGGLADGDARTLLESSVTGRLDHRVRDRIAAEARGIPGLLLELASGMNPEYQAGGFGLPCAAAPEDPAEESFRERLAPLPEATRRLLLLAASEPTMDPVLIWRAARMLGLRSETAAAAAEAGLIEPSGLLRFRDPLARLAIYRAAPPQERRSVHHALAEAADPGTDPDWKAWHRGHAAPGPDEDIAAALECAVSAARTRGGLAADAAFRERAAELTPDPARRARRALTAAQVKHQAGAPEGALRLLDLAQAGPLDELGHAQAELLSAQLNADAGHGQDALALLVKEARQLEPRHPRLARQACRDAFWIALTSGWRATDGLAETAEAARAVRPGSGPPRPGDLLLDGLAELVTEGYAAGAPLLRQALEEFRETEIPLEESLGWLPLACRVSGDVWDDHSWSVLSARLTELARHAGALSVLPDALTSDAAMRLLAGEPARAGWLAQQAEAVARATGRVFAPCVPLMAAAWEGRDREAGQLIAAATEMTEPGGAQRLTTAGWAAAVLHNGLCRYGEALAAAEQASVCPGEPGLALWSLAELIEAAARTGQPGRAVAALERLSEATCAAGTDWALGIQVRCQALLSQGEAAERRYVEAVGRLGRTRVRVELARARLLYGEWLRRENRRVDAREQLRAAYEMLAAMGIGGFAERARRELMATGETVRKRRAETAAELTAQEARIVWLAMDGHTNPEISAQLFLSPRTVEWHLRKVFTKLGIRSRKELTMALHELEQVAVPDRPDGGQQLTERTIAGSGRVRDRRSGTSRQRTSRR
jgi:DNA-binding CsgD family transcriptional regulator